MKMEQARTNQQSCWAVRQVRAVWWKETSRKVVEV